ncbi:MAG TPA: hypothetical protein VK111_04550 [Virgibacillus sp.]|nr:hypothetical protein [Virgibacillus sp.]
MNFPEVNMVAVKNKIRQYKRHHAKSAKKMKAIDRQRYQKQHEQIIMEYDLIRSLKSVSW